MILLTLVLMGVGSYAMRAVFILLLADRTFPPWALQALEYVAPSVMGALVVTMLLSPEAGPCPVALNGPGWQPRRRSRHSAAIISMCC